MTEADSVAGPAIVPSVGQRWRHGPRLLGLAIWLVVLAGGGGYLLATGQSPAEGLRQLIGLLQTPIGPLLYVVAYALRPFTLLSAALLTLAGGAIFGPVWGLILTVVASNLSASVAYLIGRLLGNGAVDLGRSGGLVNRYADRMRRRGFETTITMRALFVPYDPVSYLAGFLRIGFPAFLLATVLGSLPGTVSFVLAGAAVSLDAVLSNQVQTSLNPWLLVGSAGLLIASLATARLLQRRERTTLPLDQPVDDQSAGPRAD